MKSRKLLNKILSNLDKQKPTGRFFVCPLIISHKSVGLILAFFSRLLLWRLRMTFLGSQDYGTVPITINYYYRTGFCNARAHTVTDECPKGTSVCNCMTSALQNQFCNNNFIVIGILSYIWLVFSQNQFVFGLMYKVIKKICQMAIANF